MPLDPTVVGTELPTATMTVDRGRLRFFAKAIGETDPKYTDVVIGGLVKRAKDSGDPVGCRKVVNISSLAGVGGNAGQTNYAAAKAGVIGLTKALAKEWGRYNVTVNSVAFGLIKTRLTETPADGQGTIDVAGREIKVGVNPGLSQPWSR